MQRKLDWNDQIPNELKQVWLSHFELIEEISKLRFNRTIIPEDAKNLDIETIDSADASSKIACVTIHARVQKKDGSYSCQLVFSRSKLVPESFSQPRAELMAATLNVR